MATGAELNALADQVNKISDGLDKLVNSGTAQVVIHKSEGPGTIQAILMAFSIAACIATWPAMIVLYNLHQNDVKRLEDAQRDMQAWQQVMRNDIAALKKDHK